MTRVLIVDDDAAVRTVVGQALQRAGYDVIAVSTLAERDRSMATTPPDVLVTDVVLPDGDGIERLASTLAARPDLPVIVISARNTLTTTIRATEAGAYEYLPKPFDLDLLVNAVSSSLARRDDVAQPRLDADDEHALPLIGRSASMQDVYRIVARVVSNDLTVLVTGESGTGKELAARAIHDLGHRRSAPFVAINMAAIPRELIETELFGHERGAFTGASQRNPGRFEQAAGGSLFLDEIGDMPIEAQTRLLRVLQEGEFTSVGGTRPSRSDVRIIAATNRDLRELVMAGRFREDLYYRLNVVPITMPPLREREGDIALLAHHFLENAVRQGLPRRRLAADALKVIEGHDWPGNVRELENLLRRLAVLARDEVIAADVVHQMLGTTIKPVTDPDSDISAAVQTLICKIDGERSGALNDGSLYARVIGEVERPLITMMLARNGYNQLRTAKAIGINRNTLRKRLDALNIALE